MEKREGLLSYVDRMTRWLPVLPAYMKRPVHIAIAVLLIGLSVFVWRLASPRDGSFEDGIASIERGDYLNAFKEFRVLAEQGDPMAQFNVARMYLRGDGVSQDSSEAMKWYRLSAEQGIAEAQLQLGVSYASGTHVAKDSSEAVKWYRLSAAQGNATAQVLLGHMYYLGHGVAIDYFRAHMWVFLAAEAKNKTALESILPIARTLTSEQAIESVNMGHDCQKRNFKGCD